MLEQSARTKPFTLRLPVHLRAALDAKAKETRRSVTSLVLEGIEIVAQDAAPQARPMMAAGDVFKKHLGAGREGDGLDEKAMAERMRLIRGDD